MLAAEVEQDTHHFQELVELAAVDKVVCTQVQPALVD
jgi:hypothetical protein